MRLFFSLLAVGLCLSTSAADHTSKLDSLEARLDAIERKLNPGLIPNISLNPQEQSNWCWAAALQTVLKAVGKGKPAQCRMAGYFMYRNENACCGDLGATYGCNRPFVMEYAMRAYRAHGANYRYFLSQSALATETAAGRPLIVSVQFGTHRHGLVVYGVQSDKIYGYDPDQGGNKFVMSHAALDRYQGGRVDETDTSTK